MVLGPPETIDGLRKGAKTNFCSETVLVQTHVFFIEKIVNTSIDEEREVFCITENSGDE